MSTKAEIPLYPKSKSELFEEYRGLISICTFRSWLRGLERDGKIRKGVKVLTTKEVKTVYEELGVPNKFVNVPSDTKKAVK